MIIFGRCFASNSRDDGNVLKWDRTMTAMMVEDGKRVTAGGARLQ
jgi:hypothetical protein